MKNLIVVDLTVNENISRMMYEYCKLCNSVNSDGEMNGTLYDWERVDSCDQPITYRLTFVSMKNILSFFYDLGRITEFEVLGAISFVN